MNRCSVVCALNLWITFFIHNEADFRPLLRYDLPPFLPRLPHVLERNCVLSGGPPLASRSRTMCGCSGIFTYRWSDGCSVGVPVAQCRRRGGRLRGPGRGVVISAPSPAWCVCGVRGHSALGAGCAGGCRGRHGVACAVGRLGGGIVDAMLPRCRVRRLGSGGLCRRRRGWKYSFGWSGVVMGSIRAWVCGGGRELCVRRGRCPPRRGK